MIEPKYQTLTQMFSDRVFRIPVYQRFYSWRSKQREDLFGDIKVLAKNPDDRHHFMATIVSFKTKDVEQIGASEYKVYEIVDGQQRITTLIILLKAVEMKLPSSDDKTDLSKTLVKRDGNLLLLQTNNANQHLFNTYLKKGTIPDDSHIKTHADWNLKAAMVDCGKFVDDWQKQKGELISLLRLLRNKLGFVVYDTEDSKAVYTVFEVLNSRGLDVDWLDKCKSMLMGRAYDLAPNPQVQSAKISELQSLWGNVYQRLATYPVSGQEVLRVTATIRLAEDAGKPLGAEDATEELRQYCTDPDKTVEVTGWLHSTADKLVELHEKRHLGPVTDVLQARVLAVALMLTDALSKDEREKCLQQWERVTFRIYGLFRKDSRSKVGDYVRLARKVINKSAGAATFTDILQALRDLGKDYPIDKAVDEGLVGRNCYEGFAEECRYLLWRYEESLASADGAEVNKEHREAIWRARSAAETIEHIFPQNPEPAGPWSGKLPAGAKIEEHVHKVGNLLLLPQPLNSEAKRKGFAEKKTTYKKAEGLRIVARVLAEADWSDAEIAKREKLVSDWAKTAWCDI